MAFEKIPLTSYVEPGSPGDEDEIDMTVDTPIIVGNSGDNTFLLDVNWPEDLSAVRVSVVFPGISHPTAGSVTPQPTGTSISVQSDRVVFNIPACSEGTTYTFVAEAQAVTDGSGAVTFKLDADEYNSTIARTRQITYEAEQGG